MNVLMLGRQLPVSGRSAQATREHRFARFLAQGHRLTLAFVTDEPDPFGALSSLRAQFTDIEFAVVPRAWKSLSGAVRLATGGSCTMTYYHSEALTARLADRMRAERYDLVYISSSGMIRYALDTEPSVPLVMDFGDVDSEWWLSEAAGRSFPGARFCRTESLRLRAAEAAVARRAARCVVSSEQAARVLASFAPWAPATVIPDGVDPGSAAAPPGAAAGPTWEAVQAQLARVLAAVVAAPVPAAPRRQPVGHLEPRPGRAPVTAGGR